MATTIKDVPSPFPSTAPASPASPLPAARPAATAEQRSSPESPEHRLLRLLPCHLHHLNPKLAGAVTARLLQHAALVLAAPHSNMPRLIACAEAIARNQMPSGMWPPAQSPAAPQNSPESPPPAGVSAAGAGQPGAIVSPTRSGQPANVVACPPIEPWHGYERPYAGVLPPLLEVEEEGDAATTAAAIGASQTAPNYRKGAAADRPNQQQQQQQHSRKVAAAGASCSSVTGLRDVALPSQEPACAAAAASFPLSPEDNAFDRSSVLSDGSSMFSEHSSSMFSDRSSQLTDRSSLFSERASMAAAAFMTHASVTVATAAAAPAASPAAVVKAVLPMAAAAISRVRTLPAHAAGLDARKRRCSSPDGVDRAGQDGSMSIAQGPLSVGREGAASPQLDVSRNEASSPPLRRASSPGNMGNLIDNLSCSIKRALDRLDSGAQQQPGEKAELESPVQRPETSERELGSSLCERAGICGRVEVLGVLQEEDEDEEEDDEFDDEDVGSAVSRAVLRRLSRGATPPYHQGIRTGGSKAMNTSPTADDDGGRSPASQLSSPSSGVKPSSCSPSPPGCQRLASALSRLMMAMCTERELLRVAAGGRPVEELGTLDEAAAAAVDRAMDRIAMLKAPCRPAASRPPARPYKDHHASPPTAYEAPERRSSSSSQQPASPLPPASSSLPAASLTSQTPALSLLPAPPQRCSSLPPSLRVSSPAILGSLPPPPPQPAWKAPPFASPASALGRFASLPPRRPLAMALPSRLSASSKAMECSGGAFGWRQGCDAPPASLKGLVLTTPAVGRCGREDASNRGSFSDSNSCAPTAATAATSTNSHVRQGGGDEEEGAGDLDFESHEEDEDEDEVPSDDSSSGSLDGKGGGIQDEYGVQEVERESFGSFIMNSRPFL